ncbi:hypothetical protein ES703_86159 [subsurface metagenome]
MDAKAKIKTKPELAVIKEEKIPHLLLPGEVGAVLELTVKNKQGKVTEHRIMRSKSFVRQFLEMLWLQAVPIEEDLLYELRDINNVLLPISESSWNFGCVAAAGELDVGIIVGTDSTPPDIDDYAIETLIDHDAAPPTAGRLAYSDQVIAVPASDATTSQFTITRDFVNASGGAITVNEIALYVKGFIMRWSDWFTFMLIRDVIGGGVAVPAGETLTVNYREQAVV